jgi:hypothetical protein
VNDKKGQRTGIAGNYIGSTLMLRARAALDHSRTRRYDNEIAWNQFFFGMDLIYKF